jgi:hypothetical protein
MRTHGWAPGRRLRRAAPSLLAAAAAATTVALAGAPAAQADGNCGVRVDWPHVSYTTEHQIHTRAESFCVGLPVQSNRLSAVTYRSRWYGWQQVGSAAYGPVPKQSIRVTVAVDCVPGTWYEYRTEARGVAVIAGRTYTAAAYQQNDDAIMCR